MSLALHKPPGAGRISPALRERVIATAREMRYQPNRLARALVHGRSRFVGLLMLASATLPYVEALRGVDDEAAASGYGLLLCNAYGRDTAEQQLETFAENQVEGIIAVASSTIGLADEVLARKPEGVPLISINREVRAAGVFSIVMDNYGATQRAAEHLIRLGHRRIAYLDGPPQASCGLPMQSMQSSTERREGYLAAMHVAKLPPVVRSLPPLSSDQGQRVAEAYGAARDLLCGDEPPSAFCAVADFEAIGALRACVSLGLKVPEEVAIFGFDDREAGHWTVPALSSVRPAFHEAGRLAVRHLLDWQDGASGGVARLDCQLIFRGSAPECHEDQSAAAPAPA